MNGPVCNICLSPYITVDDKTGLVGTHTIPTTLHYCPGSHKPPRGVVDPRSTSEKTDRVWL